MRQIWRIAKYPLILLGLLLLFESLYRLFSLPSDQELLALSEKYYSEYGYRVVFIAAFLEGLLLINWYVPGSVVAILGVTLAKQSGLSPFFTVSLIVIAFFSTSVINYFLGRYGWYRLLLKFGLQKPLDEARIKIAKAGLPIVFSSSIHPNLGALTATSAGILHLSFRRFCLYSFSGLIFWDSLWGLIIYYLGEQLIAFGTVQAMIVAIIGYIVYLLAQNREKI